MKKLINRSKTSGQGIVVVIILIGVIGCGLWYLYSLRTATDREARAFGHELIKRLTVDHDLAFFRDHLGPQAKLDYPPSQQEYIIQRFTQLGVPNQPLNIEDSVTFESYFFEPHAFFTCHLNYAAQGGLIQVAISHPVSRWQIDNVTFNMEAAK